MSHPDTRIAKGTVNPVARRHKRHVLLSAYPLTDEVIKQLARSHDMADVEAICLGAIKRRSPILIYQALRKIKADRLWIVISDHDFQPMLPVLLLLAVLTRARELRVTDFSGVCHSVSRAAVLLREPLKLLWGSVHGLLCVRLAYREARKLTRSDRTSISLVPDSPRIAYFKTNLWLGVQAGGSVGHIAGVINGFSRLGCSVDAFSGETVPLLDSAVHFERVSGKLVGGLPLETSSHQFHRLFCQKATERLANNRPAAIYQRNCLANFAGVVLARKFGVPLILEYNGSEIWIARHWGTPLRFHRTASLIEEANLRHAHLIVVVSRVLQDELLQRGIEKERIVYYPNCVDPKIFDPDRFSAENRERLRDQWRIPRDAVVCAFLGTFGPWHGADILAESVRQLASTRTSLLQRNKLHFLFVGSGQLLQKVQDILRDVPPGLATFTGLVPQRDAPRYLAASDILVSPHVQNTDGSRFFGSPTKLFEYMAMGKAIIASDLEQIGEVFANSWHIGRQGQPADPSMLAGSRALLTTPGSATEIAAAIAYLAQAPDARSLLGSTAQAQALDRYTWNKHVAAILSRLRPSEKLTDEYCVADEH